LNSLDVHIIAIESAEMGQDLERNFTVNFHSFAATPKRQTREIEVRSPEVRSPEVRSLEVRSLEVRSPEVRSLEVRSLEVRFRSDLTILGYHVFTYSFYLVFPLSG
jgi:hypothetical protein